MLDVRWPPFIVRDANRPALAYVYFEEELGRRAAAKLLYRDEARRIAANIAKLPELPRLSAVWKSWRPSRNEKIICLVPLNTMECN